MDIAKGAIDDGEQAGEKLADHLGSGFPALVDKVLDVLSQYRVSGSFSLGLERKDSTQNR